MLAVDADVGIRQAGHRDIKFLFLCVGASNKNNCFLPIISWCDVSVVHWCILNTKDVSLFFYQIYSS